MSHTSGSHFAFKGHMINKPTNPDPLFRHASIMSEEDILSKFQVIFVNCRSELGTVKLHYKKLFEVRATVFKAWLRFLKHSHAAYASIEIDEEKILAIGNISDTLIANGTFTVDSKCVDESVETAVAKPTSTDEQDGRILQKTFIVDENGSTLPIHEMYNFLEHNVKIKQDAMCVVPGTALLKTSSEAFWVDSRPTLYPYGIGSQKGKRLIPVPFNEDIQHRLVSCTLHSRDFLFQFAAYDGILKSQVFSSIYYKVKNLDAVSEERLASITPEDIEMVIQDRNKGNFNDNAGFLNRNLNVIGGKAPFCQLSKSTNRNELKSMIIFHGSANLYITISPDDTSHPLSYKFCLEDPNSFSFSSKELDDKQFRALQTSTNPVGISLFFTSLINIILNNLFGWKNDGRQGIFGAIAGYYGMVETQMRGTLHIHLLLWLQGSPCPLDLYEELKKNEKLKREMLSYISSVIHTGDEIKSQFACISDLSGIENQDQLDEVAKSCETCTLTEKIKQDPAFKHFPNSNDEDFFHLVCHKVFEACRTYQFHRHCFSCFKNKNVKGCRYRKPDRVLSESEWEEKTGQLFLKKSNGYINKFNIFPTLLVESNVDIQFLSSGIAGLCIGMYITDYITKNSVGIDSQNILQKAALLSRIGNPLRNGPKNFNENKLKARDFFIRFFLNLQKCSQVAATEISIKLLMLPMRYSSHSFTTINVYPVHQALDRYRKLKSEGKNFDMMSSFAEKNFTSSGNLITLSFLDYMFRNESLEHLDWYSYVCLLEKTKNIENIDFPFLADHPQYLMYGMRLRPFNNVPSIFGKLSRIPKETSTPEEIQIYQDTMTILFQPFRNFEDLDFSILSTSAGTSVPYNHQPHLASS